MNIYCITRRLGEFANIICKLSDAWKPRINCRCVFSLTGGSMTRISILALAVVLVSLLSGCETIAGTPQQLISNIKKDGDSDSIQKFEVNRPLPAVSATLKNQSQRCLAVRMRIQTKDFSSIYTYTPQMSVGRNHSRLTLQWRVNDWFAEGEPRPNGWYVMVVDAYSAGPNKTRLECYSGMDKPIVLKAVRNWADGSNLGCPDLTQK